jgi:hypothetical protein
MTLGQRDKTRRRRKPSHNRHDETLFLSKKTHGRTETSRDQGEMTLFRRDTPRRRPPRTPSRVARPRGGLSGPFFRLAGSRSSNGASTSTERTTKAQSRLRRDSHPPPGARHIPPVVDL